MSDPQDHLHEIQRLIRCKRYEQPPPDYFLSFSDKVIARIEATEESNYSSWWSWFVDRFDARPILVCAYGLAVSSLLFVGFRLSQVFEAEAAGMTSVGGPWLAASPASPLLPSSILSQSEFVPASSFSGAKLVFRDEPSHLIHVGSNLRLQAVGFSP